MIKNLKKSSRDQREIDNFNLTAEDWWNTQGQYSALHKLTPIRVEYITRTIRRFSTNNKNEPNKDLFNKLKILDIGCGGGLLCEPLSRLGSKVLGIDAAPNIIKMAKMHAQKLNLDISYQCKSIEEISNIEDSFDLIIASEVIEHVSNRAMFLNSLSKVADKNTIIIITTINKSIPGVLFGKFAAEYLLNLVPKGTHDWKKFVSPKTLFTEAKEAGILLDNFTGFAPNPLSNNFSLSSFLGINYAASGVKISQI